MAQPTEQGNESVLEEAKNLLVQEQSCKLFDAFYGVAKRECADAYLEYGLALVALANLEAGSGTDKIMKKAGIEEEDDEEGDDEEEEEDDQDEDGNEEDGDDNNEKPMTSGDAADSSNNKASEENKSSEARENGHSTNSHEPMEDVKTNGTSSDEQPQASSSTSAEPTPGTSGEDGDKDEDVDNEEATTIEVAWEVLCLAKRLYMTDESLEGRLKLAETLQKIGEISIEWDNNDNAVSILEECLKIRTAILQPDDRLIALTYYNLGLAHSFKSDTPNANENFQNAINVIEKRIASLTADLEKAQKTQDTLAIGSYQKEINELKELLPDMTMRIDDSKEDSTSSTDAIKRTREEMQIEDEEVKKVCLDKSKPVDDISHLVKRKAA